jgi:quercetin dioxygenase-like cupin family protein
MRRKRRRHRIAGIRTLSALTDCLHCQLKSRAKDGSSLWVRRAAQRGGGTKVAEIGPVPPLSAPEYVLRVNYGHGPPGSTTPVHMHPGSETFYVVAGRLGQRTPQGVMNVEVGHSMNGHAAGTTMEVFNSGTTGLEALIMFVVDATKPFSVPAKFE